MSRKPSWKTRGNYMWVTRKPHAIVGLGLAPILVAGLVLAWSLWLYGEPLWWAWPWLLLVFKGRHIGYVGQSSSRFHRDIQHMNNQPWADLSPKVYSLPCIFPRWQAAREFNEWLWILLLLPVYNVKMNKANPRKIRSSTARAQRMARQNHTALWLLPKLLRLGLMLIALGGAWIHFS